MKILTKSPLLLCVIARFSVTCSLIEIAERIDEFYKGNGNKAIEWIGGDGMTLCSEESLIPDGYEPASIIASFFERNITLPLRHRPEIKMILLKCAYHLFLADGFTLSAEFYGSGMNGEILRVGSRFYAGLWTILEEITVSFISCNKYRITSYTEAVNFITSVEKSLEKYYQVYGVIPWRWNRKLLIIGVSRLLESFHPRPTTSFFRRRSIMLDRSGRTYIDMEVLFLAYENYAQGFVSGLNGEIISVGRPFRSKNPAEMGLHAEVFGGGHISSENWKLWGVANVFKIFNSRRRDKSG